METDWDIVAPKIAEICHEANRSYCNVRMDDSTQPSWDDAPDWQKKSAITGVMCHVLAMKEGRTVHPKESHESWLGVKRAEGWKFGKVKDADKKEHPCFVPYDELPPKQRIKDDLFCAIAHAMVRKMG